MKNIAPLSLLLLASFSATPVPAGAAPADFTYRTVLKASINAGIFDRKNVFANLDSLERAVTDWQVACDRHDSKTMLRVLDFGDDLIARNLRYGLDAFASDLKAELTHARQLVIENKCHQTTAPGRLRNELRLLRRELP